MDVEHGSFIKQAGTGNQTINLANGSLTPKLVIFHGDGYGTANGIVNDFFAPFRGYMSATEQASWSASVQSNNKNGQSGLSSGCILILDEHASTEAKATFVSFSAGQFVINWGTNANTTACRIFYTVIGGTGLDNIKIGTVALNTTTGNQVVSGVTAFTPKIGFFHAVGGLTTFPTDSVGNTGYGMGVAVSSSKRHSLCAGVKGDKGKAIFDPTKVMNYPLASDTALDMQADFVSMDSTGFTINITDAPTTADILLYVLLGGTNLVADAGNITSPASTGTQQVTTTGQPSTLGMLTNLDVSGNSYGTPNTNCAFGMGKSGTQRATHAWTNPDNKLPESSTSNAFIIQAYLAVATLTASTEDAVFSAFASTSFTINWTKVSTTAYRYGWFILGATAVTTVTKNVSMDANLQDTFTKAVSVDANLQKAFTKAVTIDAVLLKTLTKNVSIDAQLNNAVQKDVTIDAVLLKTTTKNVSIDARLVNVNSKTVSIDAVLATTVQKTITIDALLSKAFTKNVSMDAKLTGTVTKPVSMDALIGSYKLSSVNLGRTKDIAGVDLGFCDLALFKQDGASPPAYTYIAKTQSDVNGDYEFTTNDNDALYLITALEKSGTPRMDCTDNTLQPVLG